MMRVRKISVLTLAAVAVSLSLTACDSSSTPQRGTSSADTGQNTVTSTALPHTASDSHQPSHGSAHGAPSGTPKKPGVSCTNQIDYAGDPRSNADINTIGEQTGYCPVPKTSVAPTGTPKKASGSAGGGRKPCYLPKGYDHFLKLDSAEVYQGDTIVHVTPETCSVNPNDDEDISYTPIEAARSFVVGSRASVEILSSTATPHSVTPRWLVDNKLVNSPYFYYRVNGQNQITAMQEIYHP
jgi:hypothetical protein